MVSKGNMILWKCTCSLKALIDVRKGSESAIHKQFLDIRNNSFFILRIRRSFCAFRTTTWAQVLHKTQICHNIFIRKNSGTFTSEGGFATSQKNGPPWNVLFYGTDDFSLESLLVLHNNWLNGNPKIVAHLEVVTVRLKHSQLAVRKYALENQIVLHDWPHCPPKGKFDVGTVASFGHLIPLNVIKKFPFGMLNVHPSLLPRWRGATPEIHTILHGDTVTGVTIMAIAPHKFDTGKIVLQEPYPVTGSMTALELSKILAKLGAILLMKSMNDLCPFLKNSRHQDTAMATTAPKIKKGREIINWQEHTCQFVDRLYRALNHEMKLLTFWHGTPVRLSNMISPKEMIEINVNKLLEIQKVVQSDIRPGKTVFHKRRKLLCILCKDGWVAFRDVMVEDHKSKTALDFYNGFMSKVESNQHYFQ